MLVRRCRHGSNLHSLRRTRSQRVPVVGRQSSVGDIADLRLAVESVVRRVGGRLYWLVFVTSWGMDVMVVVADTGLEGRHMKVVVQTAGRTERIVVAGLIGSRLHSVLVIGHRHPMGLHCLCSSFRQPHHRERRSECWGRDSEPAVVKVQVDHT